MIFYTSAQAIATNEPMDPKYARVLRYFMPLMQSKPCATLKINHQQAAFVVSTLRIIDNKANARKAGKLS